MKIQDLKEQSKQYVIYFDYTGAGRGPEPIAGPFETEQQAKDYAAEQEYDLTGNYFVDVEQ